MARTPFSSKPLVIIDRCPGCGDWCDGGELAQLKAVARSRGLDEAVGRAKKPAAPAAPRKGAAPGSGADIVDPLIAELRRRPGNWGIVPDEVAAADAVKGSGRRGRRGRDLFDLLGQFLDLP
jgi:hypothetical protein